MKFNQPLLITLNRYSSKPGNSPRWIFKHLILLLYFKAAYYAWVVVGVAMCNNFYLQPVIVH